MPPYLWLIDGMYAGMHRKQGPCRYTNQRVFVSSQEHYRRMKKKRFLPTLPKSLKSRKWAKVSWCHLPHSKSAIDPLEGVHTRLLAYSCCFLMLFKEQKSAGNIPKKGAHASRRRLTEDMCRRAWNWLVWDMLVLFEMCHTQMRVF